MSFRQDLRSTLFIFSVMILGSCLPVNSFAAGSCQATYREIANAELFKKKNELTKAVKPEELAKAFGYSAKVIRRILKHRPEIFTILAEIYLGRSTQYKYEDAQAQELFRGMALFAQDYNPAFQDNYFGGNTKKGTSWFSYDSAMASGYAKPSGEQIREMDLTKNEVVGISVRIQIPRFLMENATVSSFRAGTNVLLLREAIGNESIFIDDVALTIADIKNKRFEDETVSYQTFLRRYRSNSAYKDAWLE